ncbi:probable arylsulfatase [Cephalotrichum gorgonifer]|uniref:Arylsulfatase n=1 Tax=Cephalotrichum gorgonifer TaxID=2041049 RepID=A0AAE8MVY3_9PEZI|nr:probable arylsulfatase [Cephalotrichum gorgonifer]
MAGVSKPISSWGVLLTSLLSLAQVTCAQGAASQITLGQLGHDAPAADSRKPNIVFILTDDQDLHMNSLDYVPLINKHLIDQGTLFTKHFCTTAICCPARVSILTGKLAHNTNVTDVSPPFGGFPKFVTQGLNEAYLPVFLQDAGYSTYYTGKLFNAHDTENYNNPFPGGWTGSDFLLDPFTYSYLNATYQRNQDPPVSYEGQYTTDVLAGKALGFLDDAVSGGKPFFLGIAPVAPHSNVNYNLLPHLDDDDIIDLPEDPDVRNFFSAPIPADRHAHLFQDAIVPRTANFNPDKPSGANWIAQQSKQSPENVAYNDHFYRSRLRALQAVDELVDSVVRKLEDYGILDNTYIFYTTDNGFHIGHHRLQPGKECGFEEDINIPLIVRGPGVPKGKVSEIVTTHTDLTPTFVQLAQGVARADFDGLSIPLTADGLESAITTRHEHVNVEFWGIAASEGQFGYFDRNQSFILNNTYKAIRIASKEYNLYYSVWCTNEHELYDLNADPGQLYNLLSPSSSATTLLGLPINKIVARLDSLLLVTKSCKGSTCTQPWGALHPQGNVLSLRDALSPRFDAFYEKHQVKVSYSHCELGYLESAEGAQFEKDGYVYRQGSSWSDWV